MSFKTGLLLTLRIAGTGVAIVCMAATAGHTKPYAFRGISLGTSLADLRRMQFPESPGARILCSHDTEAEDIRPTAETVVPDAQAREGIVICAAYTFGKVLGAASKILPSEWIATRLNIGAIEASPYFWFVPTDKSDVEETGRLYRIAIRSNAAYWAHTRAAFIRRYGPATSIDTTTIRQEGRRDLAGEILTWTSSDSTIRLAQRDEVATRMTITYEHTGLKPPEP